MSLVHWWPLNGNLYDYVQGNHLENTNTSVNTMTADGKLGKTYTNTSNTGGSLISKERFLLPSTQSMFCWIYMTNVYNNSSLNAICGQHRYQTNSGMGITIKYASSTSGYLSVNTGNGSSRTYNTYCGSTLLTAGKWYHVGFTYDGTTIRLYVNGVLDGTHAYSGQKLYSEPFGAYMWSFGSSSIGDRTPYGNYCPKGKINDIRVYDHVLSTREIKDLAKGLMIHYGLEDPCIEPTTNVNTVNGWSTYASYWTIKKRTDTGLIIYRHSSSTSNTVAIANSAVTSKMAVGDIWTFSCYLYKGGQPYKCNITSPSSSGYGYTGISCVSRDDGYYAVTFQINSNGAGTWVLHTTFFGTTDLNVDCEMRYMQFEKKDHATPFVLGTRAGEVIDNSGNGYNGTPLDIVMSEDSGRGHYAAVFNGNTSYIETPFIKSDLVTSDWTLGFWYYNNDGNGSSQTNRAVIIGDHELETSTFNVEKYQNGYLRTYLNGGGSDVVHSTDNAANDPFLIPVQQWCHIMLTYSGGVVKTYLNGVFKSSITYTITSVKTRGLRLGRDNRSGATALNGKMADFKMYATALSADEVAYEAKKAKRFFKNGKIKVSGLYEQTEDKACIDSSILQKCSRIIEVSDGFGITGEATAGMARDKSYWVQVMHHNNHKGTNMFSSSDKTNMPNKLVYKNDDCWCAFHLITNYGDLGDGYEFLAMDDFWNGQHYVQRWKQKTNPVISSATPTILSGSCSFGGLRLNNSQAFMSRPSNWWAACGCWTVHSTTADRNITGVPGFTDTSHDCEESMDLFVRVKEDKIPDLLYKEFKGGIVELYEIDEI
jgi:hypothetical protein